MKKRPSRQHGRSAARQKQTHGDKSAHHQTGAPVAQPHRDLDPTLNQAAILQMQQAQGNAAVQRLLAQNGRAPGLQRQDEESAEASADVAEASAYQLQTDANITPEGGLEMDVSRVLDLKRYSDVAKAYRNNVEEWFGLGAISVDGQYDFNTSGFTMETDGKLSLELGPSFLEALLQVDEVTDEEEVPEIDFNQTFQADVTASLHYRSQDPELQSVDLDGADDLLGHDENRKGFFLKLEINSVYSVRQRNGRTEERELEGLLLMVGQIAE